MTHSLKPWPELARETLVSFKVFHVIEATRRSPRTGQAGGFFIVDTWNWCNVVAFTKAGEMLLVRQYRHGSETFTLEIPGGLVDPGEDPERAAVRELREETGYATDTPLVYLGDVNPNPALFTNRCATYLATDCYLAGEIEQDAGEDLEVTALPMPEVEAAVRRGEIDHALVLAGLYHYGLHLRAQD